MCSVHSWCAASQWYAPPPPWAKIHKMQQLFSSVKIERAESIVKDTFPFGINWLMGLMRDSASISLYLTKISLLSLQKKFDTDPIRSALIVSRNNLFLSDDKVINVWSIFNIDFFLFCMMLRLDRIIYLFAHPIPLYDYICARRKYLSYSTLFFYFNLSE